MLTRKARERSRLAGNAAPGRGREAAEGNNSSSATPGRHDGEVRQGGVGTRAGNWGRREAADPVQAEQRRWGIRPPVPQYNLGGGGETQTRDRRPLLLGLRRWIRRRSDESIRCECTAHTASRAHPLPRHQATRRRTRRTGPERALRGEEGVAA
ncbi:hypothetical protein B0H14DRAFT_1514325 [Mycena olivaceomarginata]|nr:hypothetical protein B0H14DRAFT_1514325 [Mycena olivaceomarginata]